LVLQTRPKIYPYRPKANRVVRPDRTGKMKEFFVDDPGGKGQEIAREAIVCHECAKRHGNR
jgi:hypothetical protein